MPKFRLRSDHPSVSLFAPDRLGGDSMVVEPGQVVDVPGLLAAKQLTDAYVVGEDTEARAWPTSVWELVEDKPAPAAPVKEN